MPSLSMGNIFSPYFFVGRGFFLFLIPRHLYRGPWWSALNLYFALCIFVMVDGLLVIFNKVKRFNYIFEIQLTGFCQITFNLCGFVLVSNILKHSVNPNIIFLDFDIQGCQTHLIYDVIVTFQIRETV